MANLTLETLGDWVRFAPDAFPAGFISGRAGILTPEARAVAQASIQAAAAAAPGPTSMGVPREPWGGARKDGIAALDLPIGPPPGVYATAAPANPLAMDPYVNCGVPVGPGCGMDFSLRSPAEVTQWDLDTTPVLEQFAAGELSTELEMGPYPSIQFPQLNSPLAGLRGFLGALGAAVGSRTEATDEVKANLTSAAATINAQSFGVSSPQLAQAVEGGARSVLNRLDSLQPFSSGRSTASRFAQFYTYGLAPDVGLVWDSSQEIRAALQATINNVRIRTGVRTGPLLSAKDVKSADVGSEFAKNVFSKQFVSDVAQTARERYRQASDLTADAIPWAKVALGVAALVAVGYAIKQIRKK